MPRSVLIATVFLAGMLGGLLIAWFGGAFAVQTERQRQPIATAGVSADTDTAALASSTVVDAPTATVVPFPTPTALPPDTVLAEPTAGGATEIPTPVSERDLHRRWLDLNGASWQPFPIDFEWTAVHDDILKVRVGPSGALDAYWYVVRNGPGSVVEVDEASGAMGAVFGESDLTDFPLLELIDSYDASGRQRWYLSDYGLRALRAYYQIP